MTWNRFARLMLDLTRSMMLALAVIWIVDSGPERSVGTLLFPLLLLAGREGLRWDA